MKANPTFSTIIFAFVCAFLAVNCQLAAASTPSGLYRVGGYEVFELNERSGKGALGILINVPDSVVATYAPDGTYDNATSAFLVKKGDKVWVIDTGFGRRVFTLMDSLGIKPEQVQQVLLTHMHGDHIGGLVRDNTLLFPKATLVLSSKEFAYWSSQGERAAAANNILKLYKGQLMTPDPHQLTDVHGDGIHMIEAYGHTPGHVMFLIKEGEEQLLIWGDLMHAAAIQFPHPEISVRYDSDPDVARETRLKVMQYVKAHAIPVAGMHLPEYLQYKTVVDPSLMDAADKYAFVRLLSKQTVPAETPFDITLAIRYANGFESLVTVGQDSTYSLLGGTVIDGGELRSELTAHIAQENGLIGTFVHGVGDTIWLRSLRVQE